MNLNNNITCAVVQDLLPSYIDGLTSSETNQLIEEHINECEVCKEMLSIMQDPKLDQQEAEKEAKEINFLKKAHRRTRLITILVALLAAICVFAGMAAGYLKERTLTYDEVEVALQVGTVVTDGKEITNGTVGFTFQTYGKRGISKIDFEEKDGVLEVSVRGGNASIGRESIYEDRYVSKEPIKQIRMDGKVLWQDGVTVSREIVELFSTKHPYVGDAAANGNTIGAIGVYDIVGDYTLSLQTKEEPYGMTIVVTNPMEEKKLAGAEKFMKYAAYSSLALIDNLSYVTFEYTINGVKTTRTWSVDDATEELGQSVKNYGENEASLELLKWEL